MTGYDHAARARELLDAATDLTGSIEASLAEPLSDGDPRDQLAQIESRERSAENRFGLVARLHEAAQVHASLALVEQQRIANLIALAAHAEARFGTYAGEANGIGTLFAYGDTPGSNLRVRDEVAITLGIR